MPGVVGAPRSWRLHPPVCFCIDASFSGPWGIGAGSASLLLLQAAGLLHTCLSRNPWVGGHLPRLGLPAPGGELRRNPVQMGALCRPGQRARGKGPRFASSERAAFIWVSLAVPAPWTGNPAAPANPALPRLERRWAASPAPRRGSSAEPCTGQAASINQALDFIRVFM